MFYKYFNNNLMQIKNIKRYAKKKIKIRREAPFPLCRPPQFFPGCTATYPHFFFVWCGE